MKPLQQYFQMFLLIQYVSVTFESVDEILRRDHSKEIFFAVLSHRDSTIFACSAQFVGKILRCYYPKTYCLLVKGVFESVFDDEKSSRFKISSTEAETGVFDVFVDVSG